MLQHPETIKNTKMAETIKNSQNGYKQQETSCKVCSEGNKGSSLNPQLQWTHTVTPLAAQKPQVYSTPAGGWLWVKGGGGGEGE